MNVRLGPIKSADTCLGSTVSTVVIFFPEADSLPVFYLFLITIELGQIVV